jgi:hypothetical protein
MSFWRIFPSWGGWVGIVLTLLALGSLAGWSVLMWHNPVSIVSFGLGIAILVTTVIAGVLAYWTYGYFSLYYILDRDALRVYWGGYETVVPLSQVQGVQRGSAVTGRISLPPLRWPGYQVGRGRIEDIGRVIFHATQTLENQILILTPGVAYAISPEDPEGLLQALELRRSLGTLHPTGAAVVGTPLLRLSFWTDYLAQGLWGVALLLNVALFGYLCAIYPALPPILPFHFDAAGQVDRLGPSMYVFAIPLIGALGLLLNGLVGVAIHAGQRLGTVILWSGTVLIQSYLWMAALAVVMGQGIL